MELRQEIQKGSSNKEQLSTKCHFSPSLGETTAVDFPEAQCIHHLFEAQVEKTPDAIAVIFEDQQLTYRQLNDRANQLARYLTERGVASETLVGVCVDRSLEMIVGLLGVLKAGGAYVPLDPTYPAERLAFILQDTQVPVVLTQAHLIDRLPEHSARVVCLDADWGKIACNSTQNPSARAIATNLMYVIYTSGSTGKPKGVMITHAGIWNQLYWRQTTFPLTDGDRVLQSISFSFDPSVWQIFWTLCFGAQLVLPSPGGHKDIAYLVHLIAQRQITVMALVPSMLRVMLEQKGFDQCNCLKHIFCGGEALSIELVDQFFTKFGAETQLHNVYGPTEASIDATYWTCQPNTTHQIAPIGRAIANAQIHILNDDLQPVAAGEAGELHISGAGLARGYLNRPDLTAEKFIPSPFSSEAGARLYKTGDLARYLPDGMVEFLGRIDHQVKVRGFRIELGEIETALSKHPAVAQNVVIAREETPGSHRLIAYIVSVQGTQPTVSDLRNFLQHKLPEYMIPAAFVLLESLPLNANGKLDRHALPLPEHERIPSAPPSEVPQDALELELKRIWEKVLNIHPIGVKDNFFELGGDSLLAARLLSEIESELTKKLPLAVFQEAATVAELASFLRQQDSNLLQKPLVPIKPTGTKPPLFCIHSRTHNVLNYFPLARHLHPDQPVYGLQPRTTDVDLIPKLAIEEMAADYINEIKTLQPDGPYFLVGYSFGGLVAYEIARQLVERGEKVGLLALLDTYNLRESWFRPAPKYLRLLSRLPVHKQELKQRSFGGKLQYTWTILSKSFEKSERQAPASNSQLNLDTIAVEAAYAQVMKNYHPQPYAGKITLFRATHQPEKYFNLVSVKIDKLLGWEKLASNIATYDLPSNHFDLVFEPYVQSLAQGLQTYLDITQADLKSCDCLGSAPVLTTSP